MPYVTFTTDVHENNGTTEFPFLKEVEIDVRPIAGEFINYQNLNNLFYNWKVKKVTHFLSAYGDHTYINVEFIDNDGFRPEEWES